MVVICIAGGYAIYHSAKAANAAPQYQVARAHMGKIIQTVTGTGQISAANQLDVASQVSGTIQAIDVSVGQQVQAGQLIATIDPTTVLNSLQSAKISLEKMTETPKSTDLSNSQNSVIQSYGTAFNNVSGFMTDLQTVMPGLNTLFYGEAQFLNPASTVNLNNTAKNYAETAGTSYDQTNVQYQNLLSEYSGLSRSSATSSIDAVLADSYLFAKNISNTLQKPQAAVIFLTTNEPSYLSKDAPAVQNDMTSWSNLINNDLSSLLSAQNGISSAQNSLANLVTGTDPLDIQAQQLSVQQQEQNYANYFIRAPFDGVIGRIPVNVYGQAGNGTVIATVIGSKKIATLSLNEVDAAKVKTGDPVSLTFDAINNLTATGTVAEVDLVGAVSQGVVSYGVKVSIDTSDSRIIPGMSISATITTDEVDNVLVVPSSAVKAQGNANYVQTFASLPQSSAAAGTAGNSTARTRGSFASSTGAFGSTTGQYAGATGSTTRQFGGSGTNATGRTAAISISSATPPTNQTVVTGASDNSNTQIVSGLSGGEWVVTKTITSSTQATAAPSILSSLGGGARAGGGAAGAGGAFRAGAGAAAGR